MSLFLEFMLLGLFLAVLVSAFMILKARFPDNKAYKFGLAAGIAGVFLLFWTNGAVGIIGSENNDLNMLYLVVILIAFAGSLFARFKPRGMAKAMTVTAIAQTIPAIIAAFTGQGELRDLIVITAFFLFFWSSSAVLFAKSADFAEKSDS